MTNKKKLSLPARVYIGDLSLTDSSKDIWSKSDSRFEVKPRIQINDATRTVDEHFLLDLEMVRLDGLTLEAPIYLTVPTTKLAAAQELIQEAVNLLSGFGAFRSRGYGRGSISISEFIPWNPQEGPPAMAKKITGKCRLALKSLVNVRNKPVDPGSAQVVATALSISAEQLKAWLASAYHNAHGEWPTPDQMADIAVSPLYPSPDTDTLAWPPPMSTLKDEAGKVKDQWGEKRDDDEHENFFSGKAKPLGPGYTVTEDGGFWPVACCGRIRNNTEDTFATTKDGLFVQEFLPAGTVFTGTINLDGAETKFAGKILKLLTETIPVLKGALFEATLGTACPDYGAADGKPELLDRPMPFQPELLRDDNSLTIAGVRGYNSVLKRPRRGRIAVLPGSTLASGGKSGDVTWPGFGAQKLELIPLPSLPSGTGRKSPTKKSARINLTDDQKKMSRAQAGILRTMLHPALTAKVLKSKLAHRIDKYEGKEKHKEIKELLEDILFCNLDESGLAVMQEAVRGVVEQLALARWREKSMKKAGKSREEGE